MANCDVNSLMAQASCFACQPPGVWPILELQLLCNIFAAGGTGGGGGQVFTGAFANPNGNITPTNTSAAALYYQSSGSGGTLWQWDTVAQAWF